MDINLKVISLLLLLQSVPFGGCANQINCYNDENCEKLQYYNNLIENLDKIDATLEDINQYLFDMLGRRRNSNDNVKRSIDDSRVAALPSDRTYNDRILKYLISRRLRSNNGGRGKCINLWDDGCDNSGIPGSGGDHEFLGGGGSPGR
jgi:hypothetical protein